MRLIDKKDYVNLENFLKQIGVSEEIKDKLFKLISLSGVNAIDEAIEILGNIDEISEFKVLTDYLDIYGLEYKIDFGIARGLDYYTGMVFEIYCSSLGAESQLCGGGSYSLSKLFGGEDISSTGFAIGFDRVMEVTKLMPSKKSHIFVVCFEDTRKEAIYIANELRKHVITSIDVMRRKFRDQMSYANNISASHVVIVGKDEIDSGKYGFKDMKTGIQKQMTLEEILNFVSTLNL